MAHDARKSGHELLLGAIFGVNAPVQTAQEAREEAAREAKFAARRKENAAKLAAIRAQTEARAARGE